jgi:hypothetical protein
MRYLPVLDIPHTAEEDGLSLQLLSVPLNQSFEVFGRDCPAGGVAIAGERRNAGDTLALCLPERRIQPTPEFAVGECGPDLLAVGAALVAPQVERVPLDPEVGLA